MKTMRIMIMLFAFVLTANALEAQTPWKKELRTESDGFQWYLYHYSESTNGKFTEAAFDLNGKRLTCTTENSIHYTKGYFEVWTRNDTDGHPVKVLYDKYGNCVIPDSYGSINNYITGNYVVTCAKNEIIGDYVGALYDKHGTCIIPDSYGFSCLISVYPEKGLAICDDSKILSGEMYTFSLDGKYYVDKHCPDPSEFNAQKKPISTLSGGVYASNNISYKSNLSSYSSTTSNYGEPGLLYKGEYTLRLSQSKELNSGYSVGEYSSDETETISIYEDHIKINNVTCNYESTNSNGERVYKGSSLGTVTVYVSPTYEIRYYNESFVNGRGMRVTFPVVKGRSMMPQYSGGGYNEGTSSGYQPSGNNSGSTGTSSGSKHGSYEKEETCPSCHGTKTCETCLGRGWRNNPYTNQHDVCPICHGKKTCQTCNGTGKVSKTVYY